jgi:hypothetical protein
MTGVVVVGARLRHRSFNLQSVPRSTGLLQHALTMAANSRRINLMSDVQSALVCIMI